MFLSVLTHAVPCMLTHVPAHLSCISENRLILPGSTFFSWLLYILNRYNVSVLWFFYFFLKYSLCVTILCEAGLRKEYIFTYIAGTESSSSASFCFRIVSVLNVLKTFIHLAHAGLVWCFHSPPNSGMDSRIFNMHMWSFHIVYTPGTSVYNLTQRICSLHRNWLWRKSGAGAKILTHNGHPFAWWPRSVMLNLAF